jgi:hypothetical protein
MARPNVASDVTGCRESEREPRWEMRGAAATAVARLTADAALRARLGTSAFPGEVHRKL